MQKQIAAFLLLLSLTATTAIADASFKCHFKSEAIPGVDSIQLTDSVLTINNQLNIAIEESRIRCANFGRQKRFDGADANEQLQIVLRTCTSDAAMEGHLIDGKQNMAAEVFCNKI